MWLDGDQRVLPPELDDPIVIPRFGNGTGHERVTKPPQFVPIQSVHEIVDESWRRIRRRTDAVKQELLEDFRPVSVRHHRRVPGGTGGAAHCLWLTKARASTISGGAAGRIPHQDTSRLYWPQAAATSCRPAAARAAPSMTWEVCPIRLRAASNARAASS